MCIFNQIAFLVSGAKSICSEMLRYLISVAGQYEDPELLGA